MPKLSLFLCMLMIVTALVPTVVTSLSSSAERLFDKNYMFTHMQGRTVIARADGGIMTADELAKLAATVGAERTVRYDYLMDRTVTLFLGKNWQEDGLHYRTSALPMRTVSRRTAVACRRLRTRFFWNCRFS